MPDTDTEQRIAELEEQARVARELAEKGTINGKFVPIQGDAPTTEELHREAESAQEKAELLKSYQQAGERPPPDVEAITSSELSPFIKAKGGQYEVDAAQALRTGASKELLTQAVGGEAVSRAEKTAEAEQEQRQVPSAIKVKGQKEQLEQLGLLSGK